jgi:hypothetical protein
MKRIRAVLLFIFIAASLPSIAARADAGHDHAAPAASGAAGVGIPRLEAQSDLFEIVGVVEGDGMKIFLDRYATNEPVSNATIDIEAGSMKGSAQANPDGTYTFKDAALTRPGVFPVTFTIISGSDSDLLAGELVIADPAASKPRANDAPLRQVWPWVAGVLLLLAGIAVAWWSRRKRTEGMAR